MKAAAHSHKYFTLIAMLALAPAASAQNQIQIPGVLQGQLVTGKAKTPVANAMVQWSIAGVPPTVNSTGATDIHGNFAFEIPLTGPTQVEVSTTANLYNATQTSFQLQPGANPALTIPLVRKPSGQFGAVSGTVRNTGGQTIPNAQVSILGAGDYLATTTDGNGHYQFTHVGFNGDLILQVSTVFPPCVATTQVPLSLDATRVTAPVKAQTVNTFAASCPPPQSSPAGGATAAARPQDIDDTVQWEQADGLSISSPNASNAWNAGRVQDILRFPPGQGLLVASDEGGVWSIAEDASRTATPLSNTWTSIAMSSLALGTGGAQDVYAGTYPFGNSEGGDLWETDTSQSQPLLSWAQVTPKPPCNSINKVLVIAERNTILLACDSGLYWSNIPPAPSVHGTYTWTQATPTSIGDTAFAGLAKGPGWAFGGGSGTIVATRFESSTAKVIYTAAFKGSKLVLTASTAPTAAGGGRVPVAACASNPQIMYAIADSVLQSTNGGFNWTAVSTPPNPTNSFASQSEDAIAVSPDCSTVAMGLEMGTYVSFDQGSTFTLLTDAGEYNNLHADVTALTFDSALPATLWIGSGGGVAEASGVVNGSAPTYDSSWNQELFNLEFFQAAPSGSVTGLVGGATQDNGVLYSVLAGAWQHVADCPGAVECWGYLGLFATPANIGPGNDVLIAGNESSGPTWPGFGAFPSTNGAIPFDGGVPIPISNLSCAPCTPYGVMVAAPVRSPGGVLNASGQKMLAVAGIFSDATYYLTAGGFGIYGLFANDDSSDMHWELFSGGGSLWMGVSAVSATYDGGSIFVGTQTGSGNSPIYRLDSGTNPSALFSGIPVNMSVTTTCLNCAFTGVYAFNYIQNYYELNLNPMYTPPGLAYATYDQRFLVYNGISWNETESGQFNAIVATDPNRVYVASSSGVFDSSDGGVTWDNASVGLPTFVPNNPNTFSIWHSHDYLQAVADPPPISDTRLYLATYGRSVWRTYRPLPAPPPQRTFQNVTIEITTGNDNAEAYSEIQGLLNTQPPQPICLKPSNTTQPSPGGVCPNGAGATDWANGQSVSQTFTLSVPVILDGTSLEIELFQHNTGSQGVDNWDIQEITVTGQGAPTLTVLSMNNGAINGDNCMARLKASPDQTNVTYGLSGNDPTGFNIAHPVTYFGPTPTGSCPQ